MTAVAMSGLVAPSVDAAASAGDLIKMAGNSSVYYLGADGKRYVFPNESTYFSWYSDFSSVVTIPASELQSYPLGGNVTMRPGTKLVKITTDPSVYAVEPNGTLRKIQNEAQAAALYGTDWAKRVVDVADSFFVNYTMGSALADGMVPVGSLVKASGGSDVYYYDGTNYRMIANEGAFNANRFNWNNVITRSSVTAGGSAITGAETALVNTSQGGSGTVVTGSGVMVSLSANTAPSTTIIKGQALANLASFNFTAANDGAVTVNTLKLRRIGVSSDNSLSNIYLYEGNVKLTDNASLSNGYVTFSTGGGLFTVPAGSTKTITVKADVDGTTGNIGMSVNAAADVVSTGANVTGSFPMSGNLMSMTEATDLAAVTLGAATFAGATINAGTMNATLWSAPFQVSNKAVDLKHVSFRQVGSIPADAVQNLRLYVNGTQAGSAASIVNNRVNFDLSSAPVRLSTGSTVVEMRGDIVKGSDRTFSFAIQTASDVVLTDTNYNVNVAISSGLNTSQTTTINAGSVSVATDPTFVATEVVKNASNATFAKFTMKAFGENVKVNSLRVTPTLTGGQAGEKVNDLAIFVNGAQVGSSQSWTFGGGNRDFGTSNLFTIEAGQTVTVEIRGTLDLLSNTTATKIKTDLVVLANKFEGVTSFKTSPDNDTTYAGRELDIVSGSLTLAPNTGLQNQNVAKNTNQVKVGSYTLKAGSSEGVRVTNLRVDITGAGDPAALNTLSNLYVSDNTTPVLPQSQNNFPVNFTLGVNQTKTIDVFINIGDVADDKTITTQLFVTGVTVPSNSSISENSVGQTMTVKTGTIADPTLVGNAPVAQLVTGGTTNALVGTYKFVASNSTVTVDEIKFKIAKNDNSNNATAVQSLTIGNVTAPVVISGGVPTVSLNGLNLSVPAGTQGLNVEVKANLNSVTSAGQGGSATNNDFKLVLTDYKYMVGNTTTNVTGKTISSNVHVLMAGVPVVADATPSNLPSTLVTGGNEEVMRFSVTAQNGNINLKRVAIAATASYTLLSPKVWIYDADDLNTALNGAGGTAYTGNSATVQVPFDFDYSISSGVTKTFVVKVDNTKDGALAGGDTFRLNLVSGDSLAAAGANPGNWLWNDGTIANYVNSFLVKTLPITGKTFTRSN